MAAAVPVIAAVFTEASIVTVVGAALGAVGVISGNKDLAMVGSLVGLAGGFFGGGASGSLAGTAADDGLYAAGATGPSAEAATAAQGAAATERAAESAVTGNAAADAGLQTASQQATNVAGSPVQQEMSASTATNGEIIDNPAAARPDYSASPYEKGMTPPSPASTATAGATGKGIINSVMDFAKANPNITKFGLDTLAGALRPNTALMDAEQRKRLADLQERRLNLEQQILETQRGNLQYQPGSTFSANTAAAPVTNFRSPAAGGLIRSV